MPRAVGFEIGLEQAAAKLLRHDVTNIGPEFEDAGNVGQVLEPLACTPRRVTCGPDFALEDVSDIGNGHRGAEYISRLSPVDERYLPFVGLDLHAKVRTVV